MSLGLYTDEPGLKGLNASSGYGDMPEIEYLKKISVSDYYEDPMDVETNMRNLLRDFRPDKPFLASDQIRSSDDAGGGFHSKRFLNLRHHGVAGDASDPYLPDGTFLDHEFMERDPRSLMTQPDMRKHVEQQYARGQFIKFYSDEDHSVPSQGIRPEDMISNIKGLFYQFKDRYKNFEESKDNWRNSGLGMNDGKVRIVNAAKNVTTDGTIIDLTDTTVKNRKDAVAKLSADPTISYRHSTPDHRFKIAKYGFVKNRMKVQENDWSRAQRNTLADRRQVKINNINMNRKLANLITDLQGIKEIKQEVAKGARYGDSQTLYNAKRKLHKDDIHKLMLMGKSTQKFTEGLENTKQRKYKMISKDVRDKVDVGHTISRTIQQSVKSMNKDEIKRLQELVEQSGVSNNFYKENSNRKISHNRKINRDLIDTTQYKKEQKTVKNYSTAKPMATGNLSNKVDFMKLSDSKNNKLHVGNQYAAKNTTVNDFDTDQKISSFNVYDKAFKEDSDKHKGRNLHYELDTDLDFGKEFTTSR